MDSQLDEQAKQAPASANSNFIAQIQAQSFQVQEDQNSSAAPVDPAKKAMGTAVGHQVFELMMAMRPSISGQTAVSAPAGAFMIVHL